MKCRFCKQILSEATSVSWCRECEKTWELIQMWSPERFRASFAPGSVNYFPNDYTKQKELNMSFTIHKMVTGFMVNTGYSNNRYSQQWAFSTYKEASDFVKAQFDKADKPVKTA